MTARHLFLVLLVASSGAMLLGCPNDKAAPDKSASSAVAPTVPPAASARAKPASSGGW